MNIRTRDNKKVTVKITRTVKIPPRIPLLYWLPSLARVGEPYPDDLLAKRRAAFVEQVREGQKLSDGLWKKEQKES